MKKTIGIILNNPSSELSQLTGHRNPITLPFYARYRLVDFAMSNMVNSSIKKIGLVASDKYRSLLDHVGTGQEWGLSRKSRSLIILQGASRLRRAMNVSVNMMDFIKNDIVFERNDTEHILIVCPNTICHINYEDALEYHEENENDVTFITTPAENNMNPANDIFIGCSDDGIVSRISYGKILDCKYQYSGMLIVSQKALEDFMEFSEESGEIDMLEIINENIQSLKIGNVVFDGYLRRINTVNQYFKANMELLDPEMSMGLFKADDKVYTKEKDNHPTRYMKNADVTYACIASGGKIDGKVNKSILFRQVNVGTDTNVTNSIIMEGCEIGNNVVLDYVISDRNVIINDGITLRGTEDNPIILSKEMEI
ncbi:MAG: glucose-1-phosphate adenylyltransferase subunit GlgD [Eubacteriales bacterium]